MRIGDRDYPVVKIGNQLWMAENLDWKWDGLNINSSASGVPCASYYNRNETTYGVDGLRYGLLYNGYASGYLVSNQSYVLPDGWHVPSIEDFETLKIAAGGDLSGTNLKSTIGWNAPSAASQLPPVDKFGFNAKPGGREYSTGSYTNVGDESCYWTSSSGRYNYEGTYAYLNKDNVLYTGFYTMNRSRGFSIRLCKNL